MHYTFASFPGRRAAQQAISALLDRSIDPRQIKVVARTADEVACLPIERDYQMLPACAFGAVVGVFFGVGAGTIRAAETGQLSTVFSWSFGGACLGAFVAALFALGRWRSVPRYPKGVIEKDGIVVGALTHPGRATEAEDALRDAAAEQLHVVRSVDPESLGRAVASFSSRVTDVASDPAERSVA